MHRAMKIIILQTLMIENDTSPIRVYSYMRVSFSNPSFTLHQLC